MEEKLKKKNSLPYCQRKNTFWFSNNSEVKHFKSKVIYMEKNISQKLFLKLRVFYTPLPCRFSVEII